MVESPDADRSPVLIVGAGPTGLTLACELLLHDVVPRVIDEGEGPTPPNESRALGVQARTLEHLDFLGVADPMLQHGKRICGVNLHEKGRITGRFQFDFEGLNTPYPFLLSLSQGHTERFLIERLRELGGRVEWKTELADLRRNSGGATLRINGPNGTKTSHGTDWVIGCDGASSTVRHQLDLNFTGTEYPQNFHLADLYLDWDLEPDEAHLLITDKGFVPAIPLPESGLWRLVDATAPPEMEGEPAMLERFRMLLDEAGWGEDVLGATEWVSSFRIHRRMVDQFRHGRVFLAGDAAHIHSPVGGQGMNTGIHDAVNLGWKLALVANGKAEGRLLDSYGVERLPVARQVLRATDWATRAVTVENPLARYLRNKILGWSTRSNFLVRRATRTISELGLGYQNSPLGGDEWSWNGGIRPGERVPDGSLRDDNGREIRLFDVLRGGGFTLLWFQGTGEDSPPVFEAVGAERDWLQLYRVSAARNHAGDKNTLIDPDGQLHHRFGARRGGLYVIRPDGYVGYRTGSPDGSGLRQWQGSIGVRGLF